MKIDEIKHGEKIDAPGIYRIPMSWYHDDCCVGPSISSSGLRDIELDCPLTYWDRSPYNKDRNTEDDGGVEPAYFRIGRAGHTLFLEPELFRKLYVERPAVWDSWRTAEAKKWRADAYRSGLTVLDPAEMMQVVGVANAMRKHPLAVEGAFDGELECSVIWKDHRSDVWLKARPDALPRSAKMLFDLKILSSAHPTSVRRAIRDQGYDMQLALGGIGLETVIPDMEITDYALFCVAAKRPHATFIQPMSDEAIHWARLKLRRAITTFEDCLKRNDWPSFQDRDGEEYRPGDYEIASLERQLKARFLPKEY